VLAATGARKVDILGHSDGTLMPAHNVRFLGGAAKVDRYVALTPLWAGTDLAGLATCTGWASSSATPRSSTAC
jgi:triacylglycerol lipase